MPQGVLVRRATVFLPSRPTEHLNVVLNDAVYDPLLQCAAVVTVCFCSIKPGAPYDATCVLQVGDHPFVRHPTYVDYRSATIRPVERLEMGVANGELHTHDPVTEALFARIRQGLTASPSTSFKVAGFVARHQV